MNISVRWLRALAPGIDDPPDRLAARLAALGAPVDEITSLGARLDDIVVARVAAVRRHPDADRLVLCDVDAGDDTIRQVVCGAPNVREGAFYPFAPVGATLPDGQSLRKAEIRGEVSEGMLCSERELGLGRDHTGILELPGERTPGEPLIRALGLDDVRLVVEVTPNRGDLLSHWGVARELAPEGEAGLALPPFPAAGGNGAGPGAAELEAPALERGRDSGSVGGVTVRLEDAAGCPRYMGAVLRGVRIGPSPDWLAGRLRAVGLRPINNVVDATNYVLYELGQPLHAFDLDRLAGPGVVIRRAREGEPIRTLDGEDRTLGPATLVIADVQRPIAVAGVMGGEDSEVTLETRNVFLECAFFDPRSTRAAAEAMGLSTDASYRFERCVDIDGMERAVRRALALLIAVAGGEAEDRILDLYPAPRQAPVVPIRPARALHVLGAPFDQASITVCLEPLGFRRVDGDAADDDAIAFRVPAHRWADVEREIDLIEEIARRHGYDRFADELRAFRPSVVPEDAMASLEDRLRSLLVARGFLEARSAAFASEREGDVVLLNPLSSADSRLRRALLPGLLHRLEHNFARGNRHVRLFEIGTAFAPPGEPDGLPRESTRLAVVMTGSRRPPHWSGEEQPLDLWDMKGLLSEVAEVLGLDREAVRPTDDDEPGASLGLLAAPPNDPARPALPLLARGEAFAIAAPRGDGHPADRVGVGGSIRADVIDAPPWAGDVLGFEFELRPAMAEPRLRTFSPLPVLPATERDVALLVPDDTPAEAVEAAIRDAGGDLLEAVVPFDLYRGPGIPDSTRSIAYRLRFRAPDRTLTDAEADSALARILDHLTEALGVHRRG